MSTTLPRLVEKFYTEFGWLTRREYRDHCKRAGLTVSRLARKGTLALEY
jgi:hypothetical protein